MSTIPHVHANESHFKAAIEATAKALGQAKCGSANLRGENDSKQRFLGRSLIVILRKTFGHPSFGVVCILEVTFSTPKVTPEVTPEVMKLLKKLTGEMSRGDLQEAIGLRDAEHFRNTYINKALEFKVIEMTVPDKITSRNQKYRISRVGKQLLEKLREKGEA